MIYEFEWPVRWVVGDEALDTLPTELQRLKSKRPLLLTDSVLSSLGLLKRVQNLLPAPQFECLSFDAIPLESDAEVLTKLFDFAVKEKVDAIVSLGGGSVLDSGKVLALMLGYSEPDPTKLESFEFYKERRMPHICLPTTSGTGSEAGHGAVIKKGNKKLLIAGPALYPHVAILDPVLTQTLPLRLTVATAIDAWTHSWEALTSRQQNPLSSSIARWTLRKIPEALEQVIVHSNDSGINNSKLSKARLELAESACLAGLSFTHSMVGLAHSLAHSLAHLLPISHGEAIGVFLPLSLSWNLLQGGVLESLDAECMLWNVQTESQLLERVFVLRNQFCTQVNLALTAQAAGLKESQIEELVQGALLDGTSVFIRGHLPEPLLKKLVSWTFARSHWSLDDLRNLL